MRSGGGSHSGLSSSARSRGSRVMSERRRRDRSPLFGFALFGNGARTGGRRDTWYGRERVRVSVDD